MLKHAGRLAGVVGVCLRCSWAARLAKEHRGVGGSYGSSSAGACHASIALACPCCVACLGLAGGGQLQMHSGDERLIR